MYIFVSVRYLSYLVYKNAKKLIKAEKKAVEEVAVEGAIIHGLNVYFFGDRGTEMQVTRNRKKKAIRSTPLY